MKFAKSFRTKKGETAAAADEHADGSAGPELDEIEAEEAPGERKMPPKAQQQAAEEQAPPPPPEQAIAVPPEYKFGISDRLSRAVDDICGPQGSVLDAVKRSPDLVPLSKQFEDMRKRLRQTIGTAKRYQASLTALDQDRTKVRV